MVSLAGELFRLAAGDETIRVEMLAVSTAGWVGQAQDVSPQTSLKT
jgi:hypothetical protein